MEIYHSYRSVATAQPLLIHQIAMDGNSEKSLKALDKTFMMVFDLPRGFFRYA